MAEIKLGQQLMMTPQLQMAIRLLALPLPELLRELPEMVKKAPPLEVTARDVGDTGFEVSVSSDLVVTANDVYPTFSIYGTPVLLTFEAPADQDADDDPMPKGHTAEEIAFARNAAWLVRAIRQRARSFVKLGRAIVTLSPPGTFTDERVEPAKIKLREVAEAVGMHESTLERMTSADQKLRTPRGDLAFASFLKAR